LSDRHPLKYECVGADRSGDSFRRGLTAIILRLEGFRRERRPRGAVSRSGSGADVRPVDDAQLLDEREERLGKR
jgi:hypothetical protein